MKSLLASPTNHCQWLPSAYFFVRVLEVDPTAEVRPQVELALEAWAPFPLNQLYFGYAWRPGSERAVVYAAYRRRFLSENTDGWADQDWVLPHLAGWLWRTEEQPASTLVLQEAEGVAVLHWGAPGALPTQVLTRPLPPEATPEQRSDLVQACLRELGGTRSVEEPDLASLRVEGDPGGKVWTLFGGDRELVELDPGTRSNMDVRDRSDLQQQRQRVRRDLWLWQLAAGSLVVILVGLLLQGVLYGLTLWERQREERLLRRAPEIEAVNRANELATRIEELATQRLHPFEMIDVAKERKPTNVVFRSLTTQGRRQLEILANTTVAADLPAYRATLEGNPLLEKVEFLDQSSRDGVTSFRLVLTFKEGAFASSEPTP